MTNGRWMSVVVAACISVAALACGDDDDSPGGTAGSAPAGTSGSSGSAGAGGAGATAGSSGSSGTAGESGSAGTGGMSGTAGTMSSGMACELHFTDTSGSNVPQTSLSGAVGQGNAAHHENGPDSYGFAVSASTTTSIVLFNITVAGDAPTTGASYTLDSGTFSGIDLTFNEVSSATGFRDWTAVPGSTVTMSAVGPGPVSNYTNVTFSLTDVVMQVSPQASSNNATGTFKLSGTCSGNIQDI